MQATTANFRFLWSASAVSNLGDGVRSAALPLLAAATTGDPAVVAGVTAVGRLPWLLVSLYSGVIVDRMDRKRVLMASQVVRGIVLFGLALSAQVSAGVAGLYLAAFLLGCVETFFDTAAQAILPSIVPQPMLPKANSRLYAAEIVVNNFAGPPLGALLFAFAAWAPFVLDGATFFVSAVLLLQMTSVSLPVAVQRRSVRHEIVEGLMWIRANEVILRLCIFTALLAFVGVASQAIMVLYALDELGLSKQGFGLLLVVEALGSLVGVLVAPRLTQVTGVRAALVIAVAVGATAHLAMAATHSVLVAGFFYAVNAASVLVWNTATLSLRQALVPSELLGRVSSAYRFVAFGAMPLGAVVGGLLAKANGLRFPLLVTGTGLVVMTAAIATALTLEGNDGADRR